MYAVGVCEDQQETWAESLALCGDILKALAVERRASAFPTAEALDEVRYVESCDHGSVLHIQTDQRFRPLSLSETETALPQERFCCHNSFLVIREVSARTCA